ncbi:MAG: hydrogenase nickel incorporation protein HypB [Halobacteriales archaeon]
MIHQPSRQIVPTLDHGPVDLRAVLSRLFGRVAARDERGGPFRTHRTGHDHDHGDESVAVDAGEGDVLAAYRQQAGELHDRLVHEEGIFVAELLGATGSGKTRLIERLLERGPDGERVGVIVGDVAGEDDAERLRKHGVAVTTINTGKECHLDPGLVEGALDAFDLGDLDRLYLENVGNMVCPADFPLGAQARVLVVSTTEGDDVVRKHPLLFQACDAAVVNKVDIAEAVDADVGRMIDDVADIAPEMTVFRTSAKTGAGVADLAAFLADRRERGHVHADHVRDATATTDDA